MQKNIWEGKKKLSQILIWLQFLKLRSFCLLSTYCVLCPILAEILLSPP